MTATQDAQWNKFYSIVGGEPQVRSLSQIISYLVKMLDTPTTSSKDIARVIAADPALTTKVLTVVNSPALGVRNKISDLTIGISMLGHNQMRDIIMSVSIVEKLTANQQEQLVRLWKHSFYCGKVAEIIAGYAGRLMGVAFTMGLMHDIGKIVLCYSNPKAFLAVLNNYKYEKGRVTHGQAEKQILGMTHAEIGGMAAIYWKLPELIYNVVWNHHAPSKTQSTNDETYLTQIIHLADTVCWTLNFPSVNSVNPYAARNADEIIDENVLTSLGFTKSGFRGIVGTIKDALKKSETIFELIQGKKV